MRRASREIDPVRKVNVSFLCDPIKGKKHQIHVEGYLKKNQRKKGLARETNHSWYRAMLPFVNVYPTTLLYYPLDRLGHIKPERIFVGTKK